jgi:hypothetical protein
VTLLATTLATELETLTPTGSEATAISRLVDAWEVYWGGATVNGIAATPGSFSAGLSAMAGALVGLSAPNAGAAKIAAGVSAFWSAVAPLATAIWITAPIVLVPPIVPPPTLGALSAALSAVFASNTSSGLTLAQACQQIASVMHTNGGIGALVPGSVPPTPPAPLPIL